MSNPNLKPRKKFSRNSTTWQAYENLFFLREDSYPKRIGPLARGKAINLTQGLNCCNIQWAEEQGMPLEMLQYSAKAIKGLGENDWYLEISTNFRRQGLASPSHKGDGSWMAAFLEQTASIAQSEGLSAPTREEGLQDQAGPSHPAPILPQEEEEDPFEKLLREQGFTSPVLSPLSNAAGENLAFPGEAALKADALVAGGDNLPLEASSQGDELAQPKKGEGK